MCYSTVVIAVNIFIIIVIVCLLALHHRYAAVCKLQRAPLYHRSIKVRWGEWHQPPEVEVTRCPFRQAGGACLWSGAACGLRYGSGLGINGHVHMVWGVVVDGYTKLVIIRGAFIIFWINIKVMGGFSDECSQVFFICEGLFIACSAQCKCIET